MIELLLYFGLANLGFSATGLGYAFIVKPLTTKTGEGDSSE